MLGGAPVKKLARARWVVLANGGRVTVNAYFDAEIVFDEYGVEERVYLSKDVVRKDLIERESVKPPDLIIGAPMMESWGNRAGLEKGRDNIV